MEYTIRIMNAYSKNIDKLKVVDLETISASPITTPVIPYTDFVADTLANLDGSIQIPVYDKQQYCILPKDSVLEVKTSNSDEAVFYANASIKNGRIEITPNPISSDSPDESKGLIIVPDGVIIEQESLEIGPNAWAVKFSTSNLGEYEENSTILNYNTQDFHDFYKEELYDRDDIEFFGELRYVLYWDDANQESLLKYVAYLEDQSISLIFPDINMDSNGYCDPISITPRESDVAGLYTNMLAEFGYPNYSYLIGSSSIVFVIATELDESCNEVLFLNYDENTGLIQNNILHDISFIPNKSWIFPTRLYIEMLGSSDWLVYASDEEINDFTPISNISELTDAISESLPDLWVKTKIKDNSGKTLFLSGEFGCSLTTIVNRTVVYREFKPNTYYLIGTAN